nr:MAG TPA: Protein of unknown function (DUF2690) [Caudoviricetes sp.]
MADWIYILFIRYSGRCQSWCKNGGLIWVQ